MSRMGMPLNHFQARWERLPTYPTTMPNDHFNQDPQNVYLPALCSAFSALSISDNDLRTYGSHDVGRLAVGSLRRLSDNLSRKNHHPLRYAAARLGTSCPGDWEIGPNIRLKGQFWRYARTGTTYPPGCSKEHLEGIIRFRIQMAQYVDNIVESFGLPKSQGKTMLDWHRGLWHYTYDVIKTSDTERRDKISKAIQQSGLCFCGQGEGFNRAHIYLVECICISQLDLVEAFALIKEIGEQHGKRALELEDDLVRNRSLRHRGGVWLRAIGKSVRSLSPTKQRSRLPW